MASDERNAPQMNLVTLLSIVFVCTLCCTACALAGFRFGEGWGIAATIWGIFYPFVLGGIAALRQR